MKEKMYPVQGDDRRSPGQVPESVARLAYETYKEMFGEKQSFERIHERGGFSWDEVVAGIQGADAMSDLFKGYTPLPGGRTKPQKGDS